MYVTLNSSMDSFAVKISLIRDVRALAPVLGLKEAKEFTEGVETQLTEAEWKRVKPLLELHRFRYQVTGLKPQMDPLSWIQRIGGWMETEQGGCHSSNMRRPARMWRVVACGIAGTWYGPWKRTPRLAIERAMVKYPFGPLAQKKRG